MLNLGNDPSTTTHQPPFANWLHKAIGRSGGRLQFRFQGNYFHLLCEGNPCPDRNVILIRLLPALQQTDFNQLLPPDQPKVYQLILYGRVPGQQKPSWTTRLDLNQLDPEAQLNPRNRSNSQKGALLRSSTLLAQAKQGNSEAIARYLSESLSNLGISVQASIKTLPRVPQKVVSSADDGASSELGVAAKRLWIICEANYSTESAVIAEPVAQKLRELSLEGFQDAVALFRVFGEAQADWMLRVDLTPPDEILRGAARWGDVGAIARLLNQALHPLGMTISTAALRESTLHLSCSLQAPANATKGQSQLSHRANSKAPDQALVQQCVVPLLEALTPQGIHGAMLYGQVGHQESPAWVQWVSLPAATQFALAEPPLALAKRGNWEAIAFLVERLLNPDLNRQLTTGGTRIQLLQRGDLVHVMTDAPLCPQRQQVGPAVARFIRGLRLQQVTGVRVYGRRSGQNRPLWSYGADFVQRDRLVPEAAPEFAATAAYVGDLIGPAGELVHRPDLTPEEHQTLWERFFEPAIQNLRSAFVRSQLFLASDAPQQTEPDGQTARLGLIWAGVGLLLVVQIDWGFGRLLQEPNPEVAVAASPAAPLPSSAETAASDVPSPGASTPLASPAATTAGQSLEEQPIGTLPDAPSRSPAARPSKEKPGVFNETGFTREVPSLAEEQNLTNPEAASPISESRAIAPPAPANLPFTPPDPQSRATAASILAGDSPYPTFNSRQLNEKLMLYTERLKQIGPPDVLVVGSSRALRGIDPTALQQSLATLGYKDVTVFNFGVNGATAQVVDLLMRTILQPDQLPRLVIWADGARAFNSGTVDVTYNGVVVSEGYRELAQGTLARPNLQPPAPPDTQSAMTSAPLPNAGVGASLTSSYSEIDRWLSDRLAQLSVSFGERDRVKNQLQGWLTGFLNPASPNAGPNASNSGRLTPNASSTQSLSEEARDLIDFEGFLPLALRFNPATYFQEYAHVAGQYDGDYEDFRIDGVQADAFRTLLQFTRERNIPVVFINTPLTDEYLDPFRQEKEEEFKQFMLKEALSQPGFVFRDLGEVWLKEYDYFSDPSHLNRYGAYQLSRRIAQDAMIPWGQVEQQK